MVTGFFSIDSVGSWDAIGARKWNNTFENRWCNDTVHSFSSKEQTMTELMRASNELFRRTLDEFFPSLAALTEHCRGQKERSRELWQAPSELKTSLGDSGKLCLDTGGDGAFEMNDWSFSQLCRLSRVSKDTINRLSPATARGVFAETLPQNGKPLQLFAEGESLRSIHAASYTRLHNADLLNVVQESAIDFEPPQTGFNGATGLYAGEQDLFCFLIDPAGWVEIDGEAFAPGFFAWNSEVGCRSVGIETFWFQAVCQNHIVWDAREVIEFTRKHTANVHDSLTEIRRILEDLVAKRDKRRNGFVDVISKAMKTKLGDDADEVMKVLQQNGITRSLTKEALKIAERNGSFTIFSLVDAITRLTREIPCAGQRTELDQKASSLLALAV
jgi:hypothetical protein